MKTYTKTITPQMAQSYLDDMITQRPVTRNKLNLFVQTMKEDKWKHNGHSIKFKKDGTCYDGQHRLKASVLSKCSFTTEVFHSDSNDEDMISTVDTGSTRSGSDVLSLAGYSSCKQIASIIKLTDAYDYCVTRIPMARKATNLTNDDILKLAKLHYDDYHSALNYSVGVVKMAKQTGLKLNVSMISLLVAWASKDQPIDSGLLDQFFIPLCKGLVTVDNHPATALRMMYFRLDRDQFIVPIEIRLTYLINAWNKWVKNQAVSILRINKTASVENILSVRNIKI